ncbi:hypothetical protein VIBNISFn118_1900002 [Vibrio nigripulchritudo SFn118]|nr:hypothetical protein VIBNISFn118_1900002 [Vibrio nigripulchritudo SFn118]
MKSPTYQLHAVNPNASTDAAFEAIHIALDGLGLILTFGIFADLSNAGRYTIRGDAFNAGLSLTSSIPIAGQAAKPLNILIRQWIYLTLLVIPKVLFPQQK